ncbi:GNAT family N-acetyltransferase [Paenibacillus eucommiae]|uniref:GNAT superfamily N-acetyltransferase n=1 Tax=Paenibacillus eucommiae TaxID=1355755 RepID=A0ABS4IQR8_9BACL|nr:GNAT family N-acetyltransferase [Paenibacillus eucommiae]MBP1989904.1 GNAT superfamily N-acetyltransferase [Paenibacillus eucommiae]
MNSRNFQLRPLHLPEDYEAISRVLNQFWSEPTTAHKLREDDEKLYEVGETWKDENGQLQGYDRERQVAINEVGEIIGFVLSWRAPWTEPGFLCNTLVVDKQYRKQGAGTLLLQHVAKWGSNLGADSLISEIWDDDIEALRFVELRGFAIERRSFQSVLEIANYDDQLGLDIIQQLQAEGIRFLTLADESGDESELKLYELYKETLVDIPGYRGDVPDITEWRKWYLNVDGYQPDLVLIAAKDEEYIGVTHLLYNSQTEGMYHEYTGVSKQYRGRKVATALKILAAQLAKKRNARYVRTDNDSLNTSILSINHRLGFKPLRGSCRIIAPIDQVLRACYG